MTLCICTTLSFTVLLPKSHFTSIGSLASLVLRLLFKSLSSQGNPQPLSKGLPRTNHNISGGPVWSPTLFLPFWGRAVSCYCLSLHLPLLKTVLCGFWLLLALSWFMCRTVCLTSTVYVLNATFVQHYCCIPITGEMIYTPKIVKWLKKVEYQQKSKWVVKIMPP